MEVAAQNLMVHINGWPGVGKFTIGRLLAQQLGAKLVDNHTLINPAESLFSRRDPLHWTLRKAVRTAVFEHIARAKPEASFVFTDALSDDAHDTASFAEIAALTTTRGAQLVAVMLDCGPEENARRVALPGRAERHKLTDPERLRDLQAKHKLLEASGDVLHLDVTTMTPEEAAQELTRRIALVLA